MGCAELPRQFKSGPGKMKQKRPFLDDGSEFGVSRTQFRRLRKVEKRELMVQWFRQNFEDPAERTSYVSAEGGYLWNHGGPYDAKEQLFDMFGSNVSEKLIEEVAEEVEADGITDWAPTHDDYRDYESPDAASFEDYSDQPTDQYGSPQDLEARARARIVLQDLLAMLDAPKPVGIGHNNSPEGIEDTEATESLRKDVVELHAEFGKLNPSISLIKKLGAALGKAALASIKWAGKKVDLAINTAITAGIPAIGVIVGATYNDQIHKVIDAAKAWLEIVAQKF
jgi:hypothetical protein